MARFHDKAVPPDADPIRVPFTAQEELDRDAEEAQVLQDSKYALTVADARKRKRTEELKNAMEKFNTYRNSSPKITEAQLTTYKQTLSGNYDTAETAILAINTGTVDGDIEAIRDFIVIWSDPV